MEIDIDGEIKRALRRGLDVAVTVTQDDDLDIRIKVALLWDGEKLTDDWDFIHPHMLPSTT